MIARVAAAATVAADSLVRVRVWRVHARVRAHHPPPPSPPSLLSPTPPPPVLACKCGRKAPLVTSQVLFRNTMGGKIALMEKG